MTVRVRDLVQKSQIPQIIETYGSVITFEAFCKLPHPERNGMKYGVIIRAHEKCWRVVAIIGLPKVPVPKCSTCRIPFGPASRCHRAAELDGNLWCPCCGHDTTGTPAQVAAAQQLWERETRRLG